MKCANCGTEMETGYSLKSNTYGTVRIEKMQIKDRMPQASVCPNCGKVEIYVDVKAIKKSKEGRSIVSER